MKDKLLEILKIILLIFGPILLLILFNFVSSIEVFADDLTVEGTHSPGIVDLKIVGGVAPFKIYKGTDNQNFEFVMEITSNKYRESGLENGKTYWFKVVDKNGLSTTVKQTIPYTVIQIYPLEVIELSDTYVQLNWNSLYSSVDLYVNGSLWESNVKESSVTVTGLTPNTVYTFYFINFIGEKSNTIRVTTSKKLDDLISRLDALLSKLFVSDKHRIDSNNNGISDGLEPIYDKGKQIVDTPIIKYPSDLGNIIKDTEISTPSIDESSGELKNFPKLEVEFIPGHKTNILNLEPFLDEIKKIRFILVCMLWVGLFIYFAQKLIPKLNS